MSIWKRFHGRLGHLNWQQAATINTAITGVATAIFLPFLIVAATKAGGINKTIMFFAGGCGTGSASRLNVALHLCINIFSTGLLASSNFFMQILNAPSRNEVVKAHKRGSWLDIGVPSWRNAFQVSRLKTASWTIFFLSSLPIHLLFNSVVFQTDNRGGSYHLTIATESFIHGGQYFGPGGSLTMPSRDHDGQFSLNYPQVSMTDYLDPHSAISINTSSAAARAAEWKNISAADCKNAYSHAGCSGIRTTKDLVVIIDQPEEGWKTENIFDTSSDEIKPWDAIVPPDQANNLWFSTQCSMTADLSGGTLGCYNACNDSLGLPGSAGDMYDLKFSSRLTFTNDTTYQQSKIPTLPVKYCLQEAFQTECQLGISVTLLFAVTICVIIKLILCLAVNRYLDSSESLVTLGDAIAAFIVHPDPYTAGYCATGRRDAAHWEIEKTHERWHKTEKRVGSTLSKMHWLVTYAVFFICISIAVYFLIITTGNHSGL